MKNKNLLNTTVTLTYDFDDESNENFDAVENKEHIYKICPECGRPHTSSRGKDCLYCGAVFIEEEVEESKTLIDKVRAYCNGDMEYFNDIYKEGLKVAKRIANAKVQNMMEAEDVAETAMLNFFRADASKMNPEKFYGYLKTTVIHCCCDYFNSKFFPTSATRRENVFLDEPIEGDDNNMVFEIEDTRSGMDIGNTFKDEHMQMAVDRLKEEERTVLIMHYVEGKKLREIAEEQGVDMSTIQGRYQQGKLHLKQEMTAIKNEEDIDYKK